MMRRENVREFQGLRTRRDRYVSYHLTVELLLSGALALASLVRNDRKTPAVSCNRADGPPSGGEVKHVKNLQARYTLTHSMLII